MFYISEKEKAMDKKWVSWNANVRHDYSTLHEVKTEDEIIKAVISSDKVRVFGSKQSSADISAGTDTLISIADYNKLISINTDAKQITVQSGMILSDFLEIARDQGWCIPCLPDINTITLSGAISTGTHGTGKEGKTLSEYMIACKIVLASGEVKEVTATHPLMDPLRVSMGSLGVLSEITMQCEKDYTLHLKEGPMKDDEWTADLSQLLEKNDFLRILFLPHANSSYVIQGNKIPSDQKVNSTVARPFLSKRRAYSKALYSYTHRFPRFTVFANKILYKLFFRDKKEHKGNLYDATVTKSRGSTLELAEWTVPLSRFQELFAELRQMLNDPSTKTFIHIPMDVRFIKADNSWLSNAYDEDIVTVGCVCRNTAEADSYYAFKTVEALFLKYGGRPHWAKRFSAKAEQLSKLYPKWNDFMEIRKALDPNGKFLNPYLSEVFGVGKNK